MAWNWKRGSGQRGLVFTWAKSSGRRNGPSAEALASPWRRPSRTTRRGSVPRPSCAALRWPPRARRPCAVVLEPVAYATGLARDLRATVSGRAPDVDGGELNLMRRAGRASLVGGDGEAEIEEVSDLPRMF